MGGGEGSPLRPVPFAPAASGPAREWAGPRAGAGGGGCERGSEPPDVLRKRGSRGFCAEAREPGEALSGISEHLPGSVTLSREDWGEPGRGGGGGSPVTEQTPARTHRPRPGGRRWLVLPSAAQALAAGPASARPSRPSGRLVWGLREAETVGLVAWPSARWQNPVRVWCS